MIINKIVSSIQTVASFGPPQSFSTPRAHPNFKMNRQQTEAVARHFIKQGFFDVAIARPAEGKGEAGWGIRIREPAVTTLEKAADGRSVSVMPESMTLGTHSVGAHDYPADRMAKHWIYVQNRETEGLGRSVKPAKAGSVDPVVVRATEKIAAEIQSVANQGGKRQSEFLDPAGQEAPLSRNQAEAVARHFFAQGFDIKLVRTEPVQRDGMKEGWGFVIIAPKVSPPLSND